MNRVQTAITAVTEAIGQLDPDARERLEVVSRIDFEEHFAYQETQARAHAEQRITTDEAMTVYAALSEHHSDRNGGWADGTDLATKITVTRLIGQLLEQRIVGAHA